MSDHLLSAIGFCIVSSILTCGPIKADSSQQTPRNTSPYSVWASISKISPYELAEKLKNDAGYADDYCSRDEGRPKTYVTHFALISTHELDRIDLINKYSMDASSSVLYGDTGCILAPNLGDFMRQDGIVILEDETAARASIDELKVTFSSKGRFAGYCDSNYGYTKVVHVNPINGEMLLYSMHCSHPAAIVCMSIRQVIFILRSFI